VRLAKRRGAAITGFCETFVSLGRTVPAAGKRDESGGSGKGGTASENGINREYCEYMRCVASRRVSRSGFREIMLTHLLRFPHVKPQCVSISPLNAESRRPSQPCLVVSDGSFFFFFSYVLIHARVVTKNACGIGNARARCNYNAASGERNLINDIVIITVPVNVLRVLA